MISAAARIAECLQARQVSSGRWIARCPAHGDRAPSLSIAQGRDGRALLHCFAGCSLDAILRSAGLTMGQLFPAGPRPRPQQLAAAAQEREHRRAQAAAARRRERLRIEQLRWQWEDLQNSARSLARMLSTLPADTPGGEELTACFHLVLDELRSVDRTLTGDTEWH